MDDNLNEIKNLWKKDLDNVKDKSFNNWQKKLVKLKFVKKGQEVHVGFFYKIYVPEAVLYISENDRRCCLAHEYGHILNNDYCISFSLLLFAIVYFTSNLFFQIGENLSTFLYVLFVFVAIYVFNFCSKSDHKEFAADANSVKLFGKQKTKQWLEGLQARFGEANKFRALLAVRIARVK